MDLIVYVHTETLELENIRFGSNHTLNADIKIDRGSLTTCIAHTKLVSQLS